MLKTLLVKADAGDVGAAFTYHKVALWKLSEEETSGADKQKNLTMVQKRKRVTAQTGGGFVAGDFHSPFQDVFTPINNPAAVSCTDFVGNWKMEE